MKVEELIDMTNEIDNILHGYGIIIDNDILARHLFKAIKEGYPNHKYRVRTFESHIRIKTSSRDSIRNG